MFVSDIHRLITHPELVTTTTTSSELEAGVANSGIKGSVNARTVWELAFDHAIPGVDGVSQDGIHLAPV